MKADGIHDDSKALQAALNALPLSGGKLLLPSGRMLCRQSLTINRPYISIEGVNCGLLSKYFEPGAKIGMGSILCFADNDEYGAIINGGKGNEISSSVFVRNKTGLLIEKTRCTRIIGGTFESDKHGGKRDDKSFIDSKMNDAMLISSVNFRSDKSTIESAVVYSGKSPEIVGCKISEGVKVLATGK